MLSRVLLAHLNELVSSVNLSYQYFLKEQGLQSLNLEYIIESLYELTTSSKEIEKIENFTKNIEKIRENLPKENLPKENIKEDLKYFYMKSMTYSQFFMAMAICERIMNEKEVLDNQHLTNYLLSIKSFLKDFSKVVIKN
jgi:hypothetical protein